MRKCVVPGFVSYYLLLPGLTKFVYFACSSLLMVFDTVFRECFLTLLGSYYVLALMCEMTKGCWINLLCYSDIRTRSDFERHLTIKNCDKTFLKIIFLWC